MVAAVMANVNEVIIIERMLISFAFDSAKIEHLFAKNVV